MVKLVSSFIFLCEKNLTGDVQRAEEDFKAGYFRFLDYANFLVSSSIPSCVGKLSPWVSGRSVCASVLCMHVYGAVCFI